MTDDIRPREPDERPARKIPPLENRTIFVVEDDYLIGETLVELLSAAGARVVGPAGTLRDALAFAANPAHRFDTAILDVNLHGERSYPVADVLLARHVRIVFASGYGPDGIDAAYRHHPQCTKPFNRNALMAALGTNEADRPADPGR